MDWLIKVEKGGSCEIGKKKVIWNVGPINISSMGKLFRKNQITQRSMDWKIFSSDFPFANSIRWSGSGEGAQV